MAGKKIKKIVLHLELNVESGDSIAPADLMQAIQHVLSQYKKGTLVGRNALAYVSPISRRTRTHHVTWTVTAEEE